MSPESPDYYQLGAGQSLPGQSPEFSTLWEDSHSSFSLPFSPNTPSSRQNLMNHRASPTMAQDVRVSIKSPGITGGQTTGGPIQQPMSTHEKRYGSNHGQNNLTNNDPTRLTTRRNGFSIAGFVQPSPNAPSLRSTIAGFVQPSPDAPSLRSTLQRQSRKATCTPKS